LRAVLFVIGRTVTTEFLRHDVLRSLPLERSDDGKEKEGKKKERREGT